MTKLSHSVSASGLPPLNGLNSPFNLVLLPVFSLFTLVLTLGQATAAQESTLSFEPASTDLPDPLPTSDQPTTDLNFTLLPAPIPPPTITLQATVPSPPPTIPPTPRSGPQDLTPADLFIGGSHSLVAKAVGAAEGTRTPDGHKTPAYYGHIDPGNQAWNLGSFSYQHGASSPEEADAKQLARLQTQAELLRHQAQIQGLKLRIEELLNGIDLANQAPRAALERGGYIDRLAQTRQMRLPGSEAITWARTQSFIDPQTGRLNAPGLGNRLDWVWQDQERRRAAVERAIALHQPATTLTNTEALIRMDRSLVQGSTASTSYLPPGPPSLQSP